MRETTFTVLTLGCKVNQYESEEITKDFLSQGFTWVNRGEKADACIINTCTVTREADAKSRKLLRRALRENPSALVVVTGCYVNRAPNDISEISEGGLIVVTPDKSRLVPEVIKRETLKYKPQAEGYLSTQFFHTRALVKIQDGCCQFCSYCIVPYVRGASKSREPKEVLSEISDLVKKEIKEIVLTGINLGKYGYDLSPPVSLTDLLKEIVRLSELERIRLSSLNVEDISPELIQLLGTSPKFCRHFHIPLQSGSDSILTVMNRGYTKEKYLEVVEKITETIPEVALTTDIMVGFPGESEEQFKETYDFVKKVRFRKIHVFKFSPRPGTKAATFSSQVSPQIKENRATKLIEMGRAMEEKFLEKFMGKRLKVVVERENNGQMVGVSDNYLRIYFPGSKELTGQLVEVLATRMNKNVLYGKLTPKLPMTKHQ